MNENEKMISAKELFFNALYHWKIIVFATLIGAVVLGGVKYFAEYTNWKRMNANAQSVVSEGRLSDAEIEYVDNVVKSYKNALREQERYVKGYLSGLDYTKVNRIRLDYFVSGVENNEATKVVLDDLVLTYRTYLQSSEFYQGIIELVPEMDLDEMKNYVVVEISGHNLIIDIKAKNMDDANMISTYLKAAMDNFSAEVKKLSVNHNILLRNEYASVERDYDIYKAQTENLTKYSTQKDSIMQAIMTMNYNQVVLLEKKINASILDKFGISYQSLGFSENTSVQDIPKPSISKKFTIVGCGLGLLISFGIICCLFLFSKYVVSPTDVRENIHLKVYGTLADLNSKTRKCKVNPIYREMMSEKYCDVDYIMQIILNQSSKDGKIALISSIYSSKELEEMFPEKEYVLLGYDVLYSKALISKIVETEFAVVVEKYGKTIRKNLVREIELCDSLNKRVVGGLFFV